MPMQRIESLLSFRCAPAFRIYLEEDAKSATFIAGVERISLPSSSTSLCITVSVGSVHITANVHLNATGVQIAVDISNLEAQKTASSTPSSSKSKPAAWHQRDDAAKYYITSLRFRRFNLEVLFKDKESSKFALPAIYWPASPTTTNVNEQAHHNINRSRDNKSTHLYWAKRTHESTK
ncbi:uncharacterized protein F5147DRAFT_757866 [Suillus discolor]|uniref:Uncharacterized protein n=1 Tax=Suillus discolor TaxID=1912936 RepID=A0A9P7FIG4_9AGAM|nr:uncharacterized protein F5147DRAFT_757866 [Suillus discolor]KAG2117065.1 hypothetical protein F5147DRAFT_757866 [Suillus discolor]